MHSHDYETERFSTRASFMAKNPALSLFFYHLFTEAAGAVLAMSNQDRNSAAKMLDTREGENDLQRVTFAIYRAAHSRSEADVVQAEKAYREYVATPKAKRFDDVIKALQARVLPPTDLADYHRIRLIVDYVGVRPAEYQSLMVLVKRCIFS
jgi:hypothetical protein